jgi:hypothetical protein
MLGRIVDQTNERAEEVLLEVEVREDGGLRLFCGRASTSRELPSKPSRS